METTHIKEKLNLICQVLKRLKMFFDISRNIVWKFLFVLRMLGCCMCDASQMGHVLRTCQQAPICTVRGANKQQ